MSETRIRVALSDHDVINVWSMEFDLPSGQWAVRTIEHSSKYRGNVVFSCPGFGVTLEDAIAEAVKDHVKERARKVL